MNIKNVLIFTAGLVTGGAAGYFVAKKLKEKKVDEEVASIREAYRCRTTEEPVEEKKETAKTPEAPKYVKVPEQKGTGASEPDKPAKDYTSYFKPGEPDDDYYDENDFIPEAVQPRHSDKPPYVIFPEEFGEEEGYDRIEFTLYSDDVLADETGHIVHNVNETVGRGNLNRIGEYERDSVFVRNERLGCDYQVIQNISTYEEFLEEHPECRED